MQGGERGLYRLLDMHEKFQKVLEVSGKLQCMRDFMRFYQVPSVSCPCAGGRGRHNDNKDNHVVGGLVVYPGVVQ